MQQLPINGFKWSTEEFDNKKIMNLSNESDVGYLFEVDLEIPQHLHEKFQDYPFCPENGVVPGTNNSKKLLLTLHNKKNYVIHYRMLKLALQQGVILKTVNRVLQFNQSDWLKPYIELNSRMRTMATNDFEKDLYKLMNNAIFGKTMENVRQRVDIKLKSHWNNNSRYGARSLIASSNFKKRIIFNENLVAIELERTNIKMNKPVIVGMAILDISKWLMYDFYYNHLKLKYGENIELAYTDTDSFVLNVMTDCLYSDIKEDLHKYDTSDYPENNAFGIERVNKKIPGLFKDEMNSKIITAFVGLRSKMYSIKVGGVEKVKKAKGVKKSVLKREIKFQDYVDCLMNKCSITKNQRTFRSKLHNMFTITQSKVALSPFDDKRYILENNIDTLPWGHYTG